MRKGRFLLLMVVCCCFPQLRAQWDAPVTRYWRVKGHYNPAFAGGSGTIDASALYRYQWAGIQYAPQRVILSGDMPVGFFNRVHGMGVTTYTLTATAGRMRNSMLSGQYSYILPTHYGKFHIGLQAGILDLAFDEGSGYINKEENEGAQPIYLANRVKQQLADLGAGIAILNHNGYAGLSLLHLNEPAFPTLNNPIGLQSDSLKTFVPRTIHLMVGYNIRLFHSLSIEPMGWVQSSNGTTRVQATLRAVAANRYSGGISWRSNDGFCLFAAVLIDGIEIGYGYDRHTHGMGEVSRGSHEISLSIRFPAAQLQPKRQPQKSIRLL